MTFDGDLKLKRGQHLEISTTDLNSNGACENFIREDDGVLFVVRDVDVIEMNKTKIPKPYGPPQISSEHMKTMAHLDAFATSLLRAEECRDPDALGVNHADLLNITVVLEKQPLQFDLENRGPEHVSFRYRAYISKHFDNALQKHTWDETALSNGLVDAADRDEVLIVGPWATGAHSALRAMLKDLDYKMGVILQRQEAGWTRAWLKHPSETAVGKVSAEKRSSPPVVWIAMNVLLMAIEDPEVA